MIEYGACDDLFPHDDLVRALDLGLVVRRSHPELPLSIYTYTRTCVFERRWTPVTLRCRGLILEDTTGRVVGPALPKFFGHTEHELGKAYAPSLPDDGFEVFDKEDGSLGLVFHYAGRWRAASKGTFTSRQAGWAQAWLDERAGETLDPEVGYVTEIIHPDNRIVVDNGAEHTLVLLAVVGRDGVEQPLAAHADTWIRMGGRVVRSWPAASLAEVVRAARDNRRLDGVPVDGMAAEGWVLRHASGLRVKVKLADYVRLHRILTGVSERDIWRYLGMQRFADRDPGPVAYALSCATSEVTEQTVPFDALLDLVPDEFDAWVRSVANRLTREAEAVETATRTAFTAAAHLLDDRAAFARAAASHQDVRVRAGMFQLRDGRPVDLPIWRSLKPGPTPPFRPDEDG
ncbi:RNA ligase [Embleya sp. NPDC005971]|uniref:RNA ligase n=1 Tax=unclassified Embleya TaxID=2699296 RepID=UPI0033F71BB8